MITQRIRQLLFLPATTIAHIKKAMRPLTGTLVVLLLLSNAGCEQQNYTAAEAKKFFSAHEAALTAITKLVAQCSGTGTMSIYPDGHLGAGGNKNVQCPSRHEISKIIKDLNILWIKVTGYESSKGKDTFAVMFILHSYGIVGSGSGSVIYYFPELKTNPFGDSVPLKGSPGHWFFRRI